MGKDRYDVSQKDTWIDTIPILTTHTVVIKDRATGEEVQGNATTVERATGKAWEKVGGKK